MIHDAELLGFLWASHFENPPYQHFGLHIQPGAETGALHNFFQAPGHVLEKTPLLTQRIPKARPCTDCVPHEVGSALPK